MNYIFDNGWRVLGFALALLIFMIWGANTLSGMSRIASYGEYQPQYSFLSGCRIEWNGKLIPVDIICSTTKN